MQIPRETPGVFLLALEEKLTGCCRTTHSTVAHSGRGSKETLIRNTVGHRDLEHLGSSNEGPACYCLADPEEWGLFAGGSLAQAFLLAYPNPEGGGVAQGSR